MATRSSSHVARVLQIFDRRNRVDVLMLFLQITSFGSRSFLLLFAVSVVFLVSASVTTALSDAAATVSIGLSWDSACMPDSIKPPEQSADKNNLFDMRCPPKLIDPVKNIRIERFSNVGKNVLYSTVSILRLVGISAMAN